jgi:hypothetical protein
MHIIADEVNIYGQARTSKQSQCASAYQNQMGCSRDAPSLFKMDWISVLSTIKPFGIPIPLAKPARHAGMCPTN